jgi:hypothetical protein
VLDDSAACQPTLEREKRTPTPDEDSKTTERPLDPAETVGNTSPGDIDESPATETTPKELLQLNEALASSSAIDSLPDDWQLEKMTANTTSGRPKR